MFTGIVKYVGTVVGTRTVAGSMRVSVDLGPLAERLGGGDSVCVSGVCLTLCDLEASTGQFDVVGETLSRTTLGKFHPGLKVNLEPAITLNGALDGHIVQGHIDGVGKVRKVPSAKQGIWWFSAPEDLTGQMIPKGSVAVDGVSLTIVDVEEEGFSVALIPTTLENTTLGDLTRGDGVNIETDVIGKYVQSFLGRKTGGEVTIDQLKRAGFV